MINPTWTGWGGGLCGLKMDFGLLKNTQTLRILFLALFYHPLIDDSVCLGILYYVGVFFGLIVV